MALSEILRARLPGAGLALLANALFFITAVQIGLVPA